MTIVPSHRSVRSVAASEVADAAALLERGSPGTGATGRRDEPSGSLRYQTILDALDRGEHERVLAWPAEEPRALCYAGRGGTVVPAGDPEAGEAFAGTRIAETWRVLVGDEEPSRALFEATHGGLRRRRVTARQQRLMVATPQTVPPEAVPRPRQAGEADLGIVTDMAARLHVEDQMGPAPTWSMRAALRERAVATIHRGETFVFDAGGSVAAKADVVLRSPRRGAQVAGVYTAEAHRDGGLATRLVTSLCQQLFADGMPGVTLHVRSDNVAAQRAYRRAGFEDWGPWLLAVR